ncbi:MAG: pyruvate dehydrogenase complex dihydrolipoamide acetyltransferase [Alphaproteobacteria bacterium 16-39-46]|nr:MAG: pyruvate dehydrogenase complex dihydrolipoamide acetyltransferase [Alphaproteobacteria bacterium 16-39-46]OZA44424.1 MAG: pyruvate dehydrogenase complex dihydrolipoamide acetyltransferase [Alphaproteobacteria bacterium 17-39-52]HQS83310.1 pyruvate dehydrogenase complex dihydrolipoamide acetyltransferase [Alphaproteobacteria bacterium]HQS93148.1 pyruvate dehydrogenase complex dihydrolipoamide acetyltransferase [Alphaproteobacteria bacterium]
MTIEILMPALSPTMTEGNLIKWLKKEGDSLKSGDVLAEIETDKATMEVEAVDEGVLGKILVLGGTENVKVNTLIALILEEGETTADLKIQGTPQNSEPTPSEKSLPISPPSPSKSQEKTSLSGISQDRIFSSPLARRLALEKNLDLSTIQGSGPRGRIVKKDVEETSKKPVSVSSSSDSAFEDVALTTMRKVVAKRLTESKQTVPHFYVSMDVEIDALLNLRKDLNKGLGDIKVSVNDFLIKACARTLMDVPEANASWMETFIRLYKTADVSVAVSLDEGLITPIVRNAQSKSILEISAEMKSLREKAQTGKLIPSEFQGGSFSLSNMGMYGVSSFSAILNPPQGCILAVGAGSETAVVRSGVLTVATMMTLTLSVDHRVIDGAIAAQFLKTLKNYIENPVLILA